MSEMLYRSFRPDIEVRSKGGDGRTVHGILVPWHAPTRITDQLVEEFEAGAFDHQFRAASRIKFAREHLPLGGTLIGAMIDGSMRNDVAGLYGELRTARTPIGEETLELIKAGALTDLSVGFRERADGNRRKPGGIVCRTKADMFEVAITLEGAYGELAMAAGVRSAAGAGSGSGYNAPGELIADEERELRAKTEDVLLRGLPPLPDYSDRITALNLGIIV